MATRPSETMSPDYRRAHTSRRAFVEKSPSKGSPPEKKNVFFRALPKLPLPPSPQFGQLVPLCFDVKNDVLARITKQSKDDYDNDVSDNCDHNFGTFDDFGVKNDQKVSNNMILM